MPRSWKALTSTQRVQSSWCVLWPQNPFVCFASLMRYTIGVRWFHSHNVSLRVKEPLCSIEALSGISQANGFGASRSFSPRNSTIKPQLVGQMVSAANFWWTIFLSPGPRFNLCCQGTLSIVNNKRRYFLYSLRISFKGFSSFLKSFSALFWRGRKVLHASSHPVLWQLHLMSAKWSEKHPLPWGLPIGDREEGCCHRSRRVTHASAEVGFLPGWSVPGSSTHGPEAE